MSSYATISTPSGATRAAARRSAAFDDADRRLPLMVTILILNTDNVRSMSPIGKVVIAAGVTVFLIAAGVGAYQIYRSGFWRGPDAMFGDQHLKTSVALIELHHTRYGKYPESLNDLMYVGEWDRIALQSVSYTANEDRTKYCVIVQRGWVGKPQLTMPAGFWQGTGFDASVCPR